ncbi:MAG: porin family protein [Bacteroidia bacterium]|nr:porin family protein [Bacteroidia bacterium]
MHDFYFDKLIWEKLAHLEVPFDPLDWEEMEFDLDQSDEMAERSPEEDPTTILAGGEEVSVDSLSTEFDHQIREKLSQLSETPNPLDWEHFETALNEEGFDHSIAEKLANISLPYNASDWNILASRLDDSPFDASIREALTDYEVAYNPADWYYMADRLAAPFDQAIRQSLGSFIFSFSLKDWRLMAAMLNQAVVTDGAPEPSGYANWKNYISAASVAFLLFLTTLWVKEIQTLSRPEKVFAEYYAPAFQPQNGKMTQSFSGDWQQASVIEENRNTGNRIIPVKDKFSDEIIPASPTAPDIIVPDKPVYADMFPGNFALTATQSAQITHPELYVPLISTVSASVSSDIIPSDDLNTLPDYYYEPDKKIRPVPGIRVGIYGGQTRTKAELSNQPETGFLAGARLEFLINDKWSVVSGMHYSLKQFRYEYQIFAPQRFDRAVDANLKMVEAPLLIRYNFPSSTPLNLYALGGIVTTVSIAENYWEYDPNSPDNQGVDRNLLRQQNLPTDERSLNTYVGNIYVAGGLEYQFGNHFALQVEPYFQMNVQRTKGSGSRGFEKQLYTSGLTLSFMYNFNNKKHGSL